MATDHCALQLQCRRLGSPLVSTRGGPLVTARCIISSMTGSLQLRDYPGDMVRLSCEKCGRSGQYRKQTLIECYGADLRLPDLREELHRAGVMDKCMMPVRCVTLI